MPDRLEHVRRARHRRRAEPEERVRAAREADVISPGTASTSRPSSSARSAVISAPLRSRASTTTVAAQRPGDDPVAGREPPRRRRDARRVLGDEQAASRRSGARAPSARAGSRGRSRSRGRRPSSPPASSAPRCAQPSTPRASPETTTTPGRGELARRASGRRARRSRCSSARRRSRRSARTSSSGGAAPRRKRPGGGSWIDASRGGNAGSRRASQRMPSPLELGEVAGRVERRRRSARSGCDRVSRSVACSSREAANTARASSLTARSAPPASGTRAPRRRAPAAIALGAARARRSYRATRPTRARPRPESGSRSTARASSSCASRLAGSGAPREPSRAPRRRARGRRADRSPGARRELGRARARQRDDEVEAVEQRARELVAVAVELLRRARALDGRIAARRRTGRGSSCRRAGSAPGRSRGRRRARPRSCRPRAAGAAPRAPGAGTRAARRAAARRGGRASPRPGRGDAPPPTTAAVDAVWCGARNGGVAIRPPPLGSRPATEWMRVTSSAASSVERRQDPGQPPGEHRLADPRRAREQQVVPARGRDLEHAPRALLAADVGEVRHGRPQRRRVPAPARAGRARRGSTRPPRRDAAPARARCRRARPRRPTRPRRRAVASRSAARPRRRRARPGTGRSRPSSASSPTAACPASEPGGSWRDAASTASAIGRSKPEPSLRRSAGARLTVIRRSGHSSSAEAMPLRTRSFASWQARSARPTIANAGTPRWRCASTSTRRGSRPTSAWVTVRASTQPPYEGRRHSLSNSVTTRPQLVAQPARSSDGSARRVGDERAVPREPEPRGRLRTPPVRTPSARSSRRRARRSRRSAPSARRAPGGRRATPRRRARIRRHLLGASPSRADRRSRRPTSTSPRRRRSSRRAARRRRARRRRARRSCRGSGSRGGGTSARARRSCAIPRLRPRRARRRPRLRSRAPGTSGGGSRTGRSAGRPRCAPA